jgi:putative hydrolase of the HAD superfamily
MRFFFFGDNTSKDFIVPCKLGWKSICIKNSGNNIHAQDLFNVSAPNIIISGFQEIILRS